MLDAKDTLLLQSGRRYRLSLASYSGAGFAWSVDTLALAGVLRYDSTSFYRPLEEAGEQRVDRREENFYFTALKPGTARMSLEQARAWQPGELRDSVRVRVRVE